MTHKGSMLTGDQMYAIQHWAHNNGRNWKQTLRFAWESGDYGTFTHASELQQIRNQYGPSWLVSFRLPKFVEVAR